jgi:predicted kinase
VATLILLCGPSLAGKSTLAGRLAARFGASVVSFDQINAERGLPFGNEGLPVEAWAETLRIAEGRVADLLGTGRSVIVDDTLCFRWLRDRMRDLAARSDSRATLTYLPLDEATAEARRTAVAADASRPVLSLQGLAAHLAAFEAPGEDEGAVELRSEADALAWIESLVTPADKPSS